MKDSTKTIISQYQNSHAIKSLIVHLNDKIDPTTSIDEFITSVLDIRTCSTWGLDNWGRILNVPRTIQIPVIGSTDPQFGYKFEYSPQPWLGFNQAPFRIDGSGGTGIYNLDDNTYRTLLLLKAAANISDCSCPALNKLLSGMFYGRGKAYVLEVATMTIRYVFHFRLTLTEEAIIKKIGILPRPAGVGFEIFDYDTNTFGYYVNSSNQSYVGFNQGTFSKGVTYVN